MVGAFVVSIGALGILYIQGAQGLTKIHQTAGTPNNAELIATTVYLLIKGTAFAAIMSGIVFAVISLARSALDQATRFEKRLIAARFIDYAVNAEHVDSDKMKVALGVLSAWGASVESAYTPTRVAARRPESLEMSIGKDGGTVKVNSGPHGDS